MCGRFSLSQDPSGFLEQLGVENAMPFRPRYNIAPSQPVLTVVEPPGLAPRAGEMQWGLIPRWTKAGDRRPRALINARSETVHIKPSFRESFRRRRCVLPADGFYEWKTMPDGKTKVPYRITLKDNRLFAFAGIWDRWTDPEGNTVYSCALLTTTPNVLVAQIHNRMPVILDADGISLWLDPGIDEREPLEPLLQPYPAGAMTAYPVSTAVNSPRNDNPSVMAPLS